MTDFSVIPERSNTETSAIRAEWFNTIRTLLMQFQTAPNFPSYVDEAAFVTEKGSVATAGDYFYDTTVNLLKIYNGTTWDTELAVHAADTSTHGVTEIVGASETQTLTNKDYDGGSASDTNRLTLPKNTSADLNFTTDKVGTIAYDTDKGYPVFNNGVSFKPIGGEPVLEKWVAGTFYVDQTKVWLEDDFKIYNCIIPNVDGTFTPSKWQELGGGSNYPTIAAYENFEINVPSDLFTPSGANFTVTSETTSPIEGTTSALITQGTAVALETVIGPEITITQEMRNGYDITRNITITYAGTSDYTEYHLETYTGGSWVKVGESIPIKNGYASNNIKKRFFPQGSATLLRDVFTCITPDTASTILIDKMYFDLDQEDFNGIPKWKAGKEYFSTRNDTVYNSADNKIYRATFASSDAVFDAAKWQELGGGGASTATALSSATTTVNVSSATAPTTGQVLTATSSTAATWQAAGGGGGSSKLCYVYPAAYNVTFNAVWLGSLTNTFATTVPLVALNGDTSFISVASNQITLDAGDYIIRVPVQAFETNQLGVQAYDITGTAVLRAINNHAHSANGSGNAIGGMAHLRFTLSVQSAVEIRLKATQNAGGSYINPIEVEQLP